MATAPHRVTGKAEGRQIPTAYGPLYVTDAGLSSGKPVLLLHALGTDMTIWDSLASDLAKSRHVIRIHAPGHGLSPGWPPGTLDLNALAQAVWSVIDALALGQIDVVGTSMGAVLALQAADMAPQRVSRLVLCGALLVRASGSADEMRQRSMGISSAGMGPLSITMVQRWFPPRFDGDDNAAKERLRFLMLNTSSQGYSACSDAMASYDLNDALERLQASTLLIAGEMDGEIPLQYADFCQRYERVRYVPMPDTGHFPNLQRPVEFSRLVSEFIG